MRAGNRSTSETFGFSRVLSYRPAFLARKNSAGFCRVLHGAQPVEVMNQYRPGLGHRS